VSSGIKGGLFFAFTLALGFAVLWAAADNYDTSDCGLATDELCLAAARRSAIMIVAAGILLWLGTLWLVLRDWGGD
jgi:hypothetical protein